MKRVFTNINISFTNKTFEYTENGIRKKYKLSGKELIKKNEKIMGRKLIIEEKVTNDKKKSSSTRTPLNSNTIEYLKKYSIPKSPLNLREETIIIRQIKVSFFKRILSSLWRIWIRIKKRESFYEQWKNLCELSKRNVKKI